MPASESHLQEILRQTTGCSSATRLERVQSLWSGYGEIVRYELAGGSHSSVIVKEVTPPTKQQHPRGWSSDRSHKRKLRSYDVESAFYKSYATQLNLGPRVAKPLHLGKLDDSWLLVLEDLNASGFAGRPHHPSSEQVDHCVQWLASFHAKFLGVAPNNLWKIGSYWHLATRPDELAVMRNIPLQAAAGKLDSRLNSATFKTLVHGDAKIANFCFGRNEVAAVDFQYVGGGVGVKDIAYLMSSCMTQDECERNEQRILDRYFSLLRDCVYKLDNDNVSVDELESEWRALYPIAWADFYRFLDGWAPNHHKIHRYSKRMTEIAMATI